MELLSGPSEEMRVSHAERNEAVGWLQNAFAEGRFDVDELERRLESAMIAKTRADLSQVINDLPPPTTTKASESLPPRDAIATGGVPPSMPTGAERVSAAAAHLLGYCSLFVGPALVAAIAGRSSRFVRDQAIEALNFQLTFLGVVLALAMVAAVTLGVGAIAYPFLFLAWLVITGIGGLAALVGNRFRYPWAVRLVKS